MTCRTMTREDDEIVLAALAMRCLGRSAGQIASQVGRTPQNVRVMTNRIVNADLDESGDPEEIVRRAYW